MHAQKTSKKRRDPPLPSAFDRARSSRATLPVPFLDPRVAYRNRKIRQRTRDLFSILSPPLKQIPHEYPSIPPLPVAIFLSIDLTIDIQTLSNDPLQSLIT